MQDFFARERKWDAQRMHLHIYSFGGHATPIVTVQTSKFFSVTKNSNIAPSSHVF